MWKNLQQFLSALKTYKHENKARQKKTRGIAPEGDARFNSLLETKKKKS